MQNKNQQFSDPFGTPVSQGQMDAFLRELREGNHEIVANNQFLVGTVNALIEQNLRAQKKKRKRVTLMWMTDVGEDFCVLKQFDDGSQEAEKLTLNLIPDFRIYNLFFQGIKKTGYVGIYFQSADFWLIGEKSKMNGRYLYEGFTKNGVVFNGKIGSSKIRELLNDFFSKRIHAEKSILTVPALAGWYDKKFLTKENFPFYERDGLPILPVHKKSFRQYEDTRIQLEKYFEKLRNIDDWRNRVWFIIYPVAGILSSLLEEAGINGGHYLNVVIASDIPYTSLCNLLQVMNRQRIEVLEPKLEMALIAKDEVLILDACNDETLSGYKNKQKVAKAKAIAEKISKRELGTEDGYHICTPVAIFSSQTIRSRRAINLCVDHHFFKDAKIAEVKKDCDTVGVTFYQFVRFCEENYEAVWRIMEKTIQSGDGEDAWFSVIYNVLKWFWSAYGIDVDEEADLPKDMRWQNLKDTALPLMGDKMEDFVTLVRKEISKWRVVKKVYGKGCESEIYFNENDIFIPTEILDDILRQYGLQSQKFDFLIELREQGMLITDNGKSLSRQIQVGKRRFEVYQFQRALFDRVGLADITEIGKEEADD